MAQTVIQITRGGEPIEGIHATFTPLDARWFATNADGEISMNFDENQVVAGLIAIKDEEGDIFKYHIVLEDGDTHAIEIPDIDF